MKKLLALVLVSMICLSLSTAFAAISGEIEIITAGDDMEKSFNDVKLNTPIEIPDYAAITLNSFEYFDYLGFQTKWSRRSQYRDSDYTSGADADYAVLRIGILNMTVIPENYADNLKVNFIYKDKYVYEGWIAQYNYTDTEKYIKEIGITSEINQFYEGHYALVCKLPNAIVNDKTSSLKIIINFGDYELTHNVIRK